MADLRALAQPECNRADAGRSFAWLVAATMAIRL
jgi:hypothetical protein